MKFKCWDIKINRKKLNLKKNSFCIDEIDCCVCTEEMKYLLDLFAVYVLKKCSIYCLFVFFL